MAGLSEPTFGTSCASLRIGNSHQLVLVSGLGLSGVASPASLLSPLSKPQSRRRGIKRPCLRLALGPFSSLPAVGRGRVRFRPVSTVKADVVAVGLPATVVALFSLRRVAGADAAAATWAVGGRVASQGRRVGVSGPTVSAAGGGGRTGPELRLGRSETFCGRQKAFFALFGASLLGRQGPTAEASSSLGRRRQGLVVCRLAAGTGNRRSAT